VFEGGALRQNAMHEYGIMQTTLELALKEALTAGACEIHELRLRVGRLSGVVPEALSYAFEVLRAETMAAGARLEIESVPAVMWCEACQGEFESPEFTCECPRCGVPSRELRRGREMELVSMEIS
jgi:hydrogenase nickel incorporation protein HypA/HybF